MSEGRKKEIYRDVRFFHGAIQLTGTEGASMRLRCWTLPSKPGFTVHMASLCNGGAKNKIVIRGKGLHFMKAINAIIALSLQKSK